MVHSYLPGTTDTVPFRGRLSPDRPTGGVPNRYPRPVAGFNTFENPFLPHFRVTFAEPRSFAGDASALVWVSSPTLKDGGELFVELFADGGPVGSVKVPEAQVGENPTRWR